MEWTLVLFDVESIPLESKSLPLEWIPGLTSECVFYPLRWMCYISTMAGSWGLKIYSRVHENPIFSTEKKRSKNIDFSTRYRAVNLIRFYALYVRSEKRLKSYTYFVTVLFILKIRYDIEAWYQKMQHLPRFFSQKAGSKTVELM